MSVEQTAMPFPAARRRIRHPQPRTQSAIEFLRKAGAKIYAAPDGTYAINNGHGTAADIRRLARSAGWQP